MVYFLLNTHKDVHNMPTYVGMDECASCHQVQYSSLSKTLHPKIFRPVTSMKEILGDFSSNNPLVNFKKEDITYVVGSKWEQVYMHMIDGEYYPFTAKWMVTTQKWVPYKVHDWKQTPASTKCNGCHTTGYSQKDNSFNEFGVKCEACHGPASEHVVHQKKINNIECKVCHKEHTTYKDDIIVSQKSAVCGQCHSRGTSAMSINGKTTLFNFPLEYIPGEDLNASFVKSSLNNDKKNWWGNGLSKNRHQEFADFSFSGHSKALQNLKTKKNPHGGKTDDNCLRCHSEDYRSAKEGNKPSIEEAKLGISCVTCHEPHGIDNTIRSKQSIDTRCTECHIDSFTQKHSPCPDTKASCVECHMPLIGKTGGTYTIRSHAFKIIPPEATEKYSMPSSCQNGACHADKSVDWAIKEYNNFYKKDKKRTLSDVLKNK